MTGPYVIDWTPELRAEGLLDFEFAGGNGDQCQQIGNAVPPLLAEVFLTALWAEPVADPWADVFELADNAGALIERAATVEGCEAA